MLECAKCWRAILTSVNCRRLSEEQRFVARSNVANPTRAHALDSASENAARQPRIVIRFYLSDETKNLIGIEIENRALNAGNETRIR